MEYALDEMCNKTVNDLINCSLELALTADHSLKPEVVLVPLTFAVIFLLGGSGNVLLILSFARHKKLSTTHNALVVNLAAGDLLMLLVGLPFNSVYYTVPSWPFGDFVCRLSRFAQTLTTAVTVGTLMVLSVERLLIVTGRRRYQSQAASPAAAPRWLLLAIWMVSLGLAVPDILSSKMITTHDVILDAAGRRGDEDICYDFNPALGAGHAQALVLVKFAVLFCLPLLVISPCYVALALHLLFRTFASRSRAAASSPSSAVDGAEVPSCRTPLTAKQGGGGGRGSKNRGSPTKINDDEPKQEVDGTRDRAQLLASAPIDHNTSSPQAQSYQSHPCPAASNITSGILAGGSKPKAPPPTRKQRRLAVTVLCLVLVFVVCWLPRHVFLIWFHFDPSPFNTFWHVVKIASFCLLFANSALNPYVFYFLDLRFRAFVHAVLCCRKVARGAAGEEEGATGRGVSESVAATGLEDRKTTYIAMEELPAGRVDHV